MTKLTKLGLTYKNYSNTKRKLTKLGFTYKIWKKTQKQTRGVANVILNVLWSANLTLNVPLSVSLFVVIRKSSAQSLTANKKNSDTGRESYRLYLQLSCGEPLILSTRWGTSLSRNRSLLMNHVWVCWTNAPCAWRFIIKFLWCLTFSLLRTQT